MSKKTVSVILTVVYFFSALQFVRFYVQSTHFYLHLNSYLYGHERLPFQERVLPVFFMRPFYESAWVAKHLSHSSGAFTPELGPFYLLSLVSFIVAAIYTQKLYTAVSASHLNSFLVFPIFLYTVIWTYTIHSEANYSYPYDLPALAFFTAGLYYIYQRSFWGLFLVVLIGTFNRETTLFLIAIYVIDSATPISEKSWWRFDLTGVSFPRLALLSAVWITVKVTLAHHFAANNSSESFFRLSYNAARLKPRLLPALLNICGYTVPLVVVFRRYINNLRFRAYLRVLPLWFAVMLCSGVLLETRIYGELCSFCAVALTVMIEGLAAKVTYQTSSQDQGAVGPIRAGQEADGSIAA